MAGWDRGGRGGWDDTGGGSDHEADWGWGDPKNEPGSMELDGGYMTEKKPEVLGKPGPTENIIRVRMVDKNLDIHTGDPSIGELKTAADLYRLLTRDHGLNTETHRIMNQEGDHIEEGGTELKIPSTYIVEANPIRITIQHDGHSSNLDDIAPHTEIAELLKEYRRKTELTQSVPLSYLSWEGRQLDSKRTVESLGLRDGVVLMGQFPVTVKDLECKLDTEVKVYPFDNVPTLVNKYLEETRRVRHYGSKLVFDGQEYDCDSANDSGMEGGRTLHDIGIRENSSLAYHSPDFPVKLRDAKSQQQEPVALRVMDHMEVKTVKNLYLTHLHNEGQYNLSIEDFRLIFAGQEMQDEHKLYQYGQYQLRSHSIIDVQQEDLKIAIKYECSKCGKIVAIRASEMVRCNECGCRVVYKPRSQKYKPRLHCR